jgi:hypothetical protein
MAFIILRRSRNSKGYYLVQSFRNEQGRSRRRILCYLGREEDGTDTLAKALAHWQRINRRIARELRTAAGRRSQLLRSRRDAAAVRIALLKHHLELAAVAAAEKRRKAEQAAAELRRRELMAEMAEHWQAIDRLRRLPSAEHAQAAKRAFRFLALRLHPDQGGTHQDFLRLKDAYDRARAALRRSA